MFRSLVWIASAVFLGSCGLTVQEFDGKVRVDIPINGNTNTYENTLTVDTDENPDIRDNRDKLIAGSGKIRRIEFELIRVGGNNKAQFAWGEVYLKPAGQGTFAAPSPANAHAIFVSIPIMGADGTALVGQKYNLEISPTKRAEIARLAFEHTKLDIRVLGQTDGGPVAFDVRVVFDVEFEAGL